MKDFQRPAGLSCLYNSPVERHVKERLVGAAVLVAAAVILIPELLSGPRHATTAAAPVRVGEAPIKTYTIDLNRPRAAPAAVEESAPPPEASEPVAADEISPAPTPVGRDASATVDAPVTASPAEPAAANPPPAVPTPKPMMVKPTQTKPESVPGKPAAPRTNAPKPAATDEVRKSPPPEVTEPRRDNALALASTVPNSKAAAAKQWAVQLGSFASKANAERLVQEWEGRGQHGMMASVKTARGTLYRVRLGPFADRAAADAALRKVKPTISGAAVVAHP